MSDDELRATIQQIREFQEDGRFSRDEYVKVLKQLRLDPGEFENEVRRQLVRRKMEGLIKQGVKVSDEEVQQAYRERHERVRAAWAYADVKPVMAAVQVADADLEPYVKAHQPQFSQPERRKLQYVIVSPKKARGHRVGRGGGGLLQGARRRVRRAEAPAGVPRARAGAPGGRQRRGERGEGEGRGRHQAREGRRGLRQARPRDLRGQGQRGPGRRPGLRRGRASWWRPSSRPPSRSRRARSRRPVRTPFGYHAIRVLDVKEGGKAPAQGRRAQDQGDAHRAEERAGRADAGRRGAGRAAVRQGFPRRGQASRRSTPRRPPSAAATRSARPAAIRSSTRPSSGSRWAGSPRRSRPRAASRSSRSSSRSRPGCRRWPRSGIAWWRRSSASAPSSR